MKWSILILTQPSRSALLKRLKQRLVPQLYNDIELLEYVFDPAKSYGQNCEELRQKAVGRYINFVDDDDLVAEDYVATVLPLLDGVDYIGFQVAVYFDGVFQKNAIHSLACRGWSEDDKYYYRDLSHLNPMRRDLAMRVSMSAGGRNADWFWANGIRDLGIVSTEHYIERPMYLYYCRFRKADGCG